MCVTTTAASVKELDKNIDRVVTNYMADLEDDRDLVKEEIHQLKIKWQDVAEKDRPNTAASTLKACDKSCLESCALYRLHQLSAKGHLVA